MQFSDLIKLQRRNLSLTQQDLAQRVGISRGYLSAMETRRCRPSRSRKVLRSLERELFLRRGELFAAGAATTSSGHLDNRDFPPPQPLPDRREPTRRRPDTNWDIRRLMIEAAGDNHQVLGDAGSPVPVINSVAAGYPHEFTDLDYPPSVADEYVFCPAVRDPQAFAARVVGDSMEPDYVEGDIVVFSPNTRPQEGNDCFVRFDADEGTTFKRFFTEDDYTLRLEPLNRRYPSNTYPAEQITGLWPAIFRVQRLRPI